MSIQQSKDLLQERLFCAGQLKSRQCQCGRAKQAGMAVCYLCWGKLPQSARHALYQPIGGGFEAAMREAYGLLADVPHRCAPAPEFPEIMEVL